MDGWGLQTGLYQLEHWADRWVGQQLDHLSWSSLGVLAIAGLATSLTPCMLSMLPITLGYIGGYEAQGQRQATWQSLWFSSGLATTLTLMGVGAVLLGRVYGQIGVGLPVIVAAIAILMGLNLLEIIPLRLPGLGDIPLPQGWPHGLRSYLLGMTFGLVASPCSTPVLATLLAWVATAQQLWIGGVLLLAYALGYVSPLIIAGLFVGSLKQLLTLRRWSGWINPASGTILVGFGVFTLLTRLFPTTNF